MEEYQYQPNDIESDQFLSEVPMALMEENIKAQFANPMEYRKKDHITTFLGMYYYSLGEINPEAEDMDAEADNLMMLRDEFYTFMRKIMEQYLGLGFVNFEEKSKSEQDRVIHYTYRFFISNIKKNFVCLIMNYLDRNRKLYTDQEDVKRKDITTLALRKEEVDPTDIYIIANLYSLIQEILAEEIDVDEFLENCDDEESFLETRFVKEQFDQFELTGNFVPKYIKMISPDFMSEIETKIRNRILSKYTKAKESEEE